LDTTQGMDSYLKVMDGFAQDVGRMSRRFKVAEGWRRHLHFGFCEEQADPLRAALGKNYLINRKYESSLENGI
jgi:hypothetical protein